MKEKLQEIKMKVEQILKNAEDLDTLENIRFSIWAKKEN